MYKIKGNEQTLVYSHDMDECTKGNILFYASGVNRFQPYDPFVIEVLDANGDVLIKCDIQTEEMDCGNLGVNDCYRVDDAVKEIDRNLKLHEAGGEYERNIVLDKIELV